MDVVGADFVPGRPPGPFPCFALSSLIRFIASFVMVLLIRLEVSTLARDQLRSSQTSLLVVIVVIVFGGRGGGSKSFASIAISLLHRPPETGSLVFVCSFHY